MQLKGVLLNFAVRAHLPERLPGVLTVLLIALICYRVAELTWHAVPMQSVGEPLLPEAEFAAAPTQKAATQTSISQWNLFGRFEVAVAPQVEEQVVVPETRLNLTLLGVFASASKTTAKAIIGEPSGTEEYYSVGMLVPGGATLEEIHADHVMLKRNNRLEMLRLSVDEEGGGGVSFAAPSAQQARRSMSPPANLAGDQRSTGAMLREYRDALNQDPQSVMDLVRAEPVREGDKLVGYRISPGRDRQLLTRFGLRAGDVVTSVNGVRLDNPIKGLEIIQNLQTAGSVSVDVTRNGVSQSFSFALE